MGISGSGKDYLAQHLIDNFNFTRFSFSDQLKKLAHTIYPWLQIDYPPIKKEKVLNITVSTGELILASPREIWIQLNGLREVENLIFIRMLEEELQCYFKKNELAQHVIITDIRSNEEFKWCKDNSFKIIYIRPSDRLYQQYDIDKYIEDNKERADYTFKNDFNGISAFNRFCEEHIKT